MVRTSPSVLANHRAIAQREAPLSSRRNEAVSPSSSHHRSSQRQHDSYDRDESPRRASSYHEHRSSSARRRAEDRSDQPADYNNNEYSLSHSHSHSHSSHHRSHTPQHSARALRDKHNHSDEKDVAESYDTEIRRIQELRKQLLMPFSHNPQAPSSHSHSRRAASPPSVSFDHHSYSKELAAPHRLPYANHADYERERPAANRQSDPYRLGVSPPHVASSLSNRRGTEPPIRVPEQHKLQQDRLGLYFGAQSVPVMSRTISDSQRTSNGGDGYLCDVDEDDGEESRKRQESEVAESLEENDESDSGSGDDGRAEGQEDEGGAKDYNDSHHHRKNSKVPSLPLQQIASHSPAALIRASVARSPSMGPKSTPAHSPSYDHSAMDAISPPLPPLPASLHVSSPLRAPVAPSKRSSPPMRGSNGAVPDLPSLSSSVNRNYPASDRATPAYPSSVPTTYPHSNDHSDSVKPSSSPNWAPAYNVPVISRRDDPTHPYSNSPLPLPPASHPSALVPSAHTHTAKRVEIRPTYVESDAIRALHATVGAHESSEPPKSCCVVM